MFPECAECAETIWGTGFAENPEDLNTFQTKFSNISECIGSPVWRHVKHATTIETDIICVISVPMGITNRQGNCSITETITVKGEIVLEIIGVRVKRG